MPTSTNQKTVGRYGRYPDTTGKRQAEGGRRLGGETRASRPGAPLVTVVTVCWNSAATIGQTIRSVRDQTYDNIEYVIVDGGSDDGTLGIIRAHEADIDYFVSEPDDGLYFAMNKGLELASGEFILILNSDDWYMPDTVAALVAAKKYSCCDFVSARAQHVDADGRETEIMHSVAFDASAYLRTPLRHETMLLSAKIYDAIGLYDTRYRIISDYDFIIRLFQAGYTHYLVPKPFLKFRVTGVSHTDMTGVIAERQALVGNYFPFLSEDEVDFLCDRKNHGGQRLLDLADKYSKEKILGAAIRAYVSDHARLAATGRGKVLWRPGAQLLLDRIRKSEEGVSPKISVILAVYNGEKTMSAAIDSVLAQTFRDIELICVNDQTPDGSQAIIDDYCRRDPRVKSVINERNIGLGATRNRGIREAQGAFIFHIDPDDTLPENALETLLRHAQEHGSELVRGAYLRHQSHVSDAKFKPQVIYPLGEARTVINAKISEVPELLRTPEGHWAYLYRAGLARRVPYPNDLKMGQDSIFLFSVLPAAATITIIPDVVYNYLENPNSTMNVFVVQKYLDVLEWRRRAYYIQCDYGLPELAAELVSKIGRLHWHDLFFAHYAAHPDPDAVVRLGRILRALCAEAGIETFDPGIPEKRRRFLELLLMDRVSAAIALIAPPDARDAKFPPHAFQDRPDVSIILPFYAAEKTIHASFDSLLAQTLENFEVVCVDDCAIDGTQAIVNEYMARDLRIGCIHNKRNIGLGASRNAGIRAARGRYVFHIDPDDVIPPDALALLVARADADGADMTGGAFMHEQFLMGQESKASRKGIDPAEGPIVATTLAARPGLLKSTEGHWSYLYRADFARRVFYPEDLKMGQDSIFLVHALSRARRISVIPDIVYRYRANPESAMNVFTFRKYIDEIEWRYRAWSTLAGRGFGDLGEHLLCNYWNMPFFDALDARFDAREKRDFFRRLAYAFRAAGNGDLAKTKNPALRARLSERLAHFAKLPARTGASRPADAPLRIAVLSTSDHGGAGLACLRSVEGLRAAGHEVTLFAAFPHNDAPHIWRLPIDSAHHAPGIDEDGLRHVWRRMAVLTRQEEPNLKARELFSKTGSVVDAAALGAAIDGADIVHLHWTVGVIDYDRLAEMVRGKPVVWTLHDMNPITGGCHYSEGCEGYRGDCRACPLLAGESDLPHRAWAKKKAALSRIERLEAICPSEWLAGRVRDSSLLGERPVHVIPNILAGDDFRPTNRMVARQILGLPAEARLIAFGADSLENRRKGGDILRDSLRHLVRMEGMEGVEGVFFGASRLALDMPVHNMGYVQDARRLSLIYAAADVFAFPSREDNAPQTVIEALLSGTPVVGFPVGNLPDLIRHEDTGYVARYADPEDFARGLAWALRDAGSPAALRRGLWGRIAARRLTDPEAAIGRHLAVYRDMLDTPTRTRDTAAQGQEGPAPDAMRPMAVR